MHAEKINKNYLRRILRCGGALCFHFVELHISPLVFLVESFIALAIRVYLLFGLLCIDGNALVSY